MTTILLIDDEPQVRSVMAKVLRKAGYEILTAESGANAIQISQEFTGDIELVISDLSMPNMSGQEAVRQLLLTRPKLKVIFISGYTSGQLPEVDPTHHLSCYLAKPFPMAELITTVKTMVSHDKCPDPT